MTEEEQKAAVLRLLAGQPDGEQLAYVLGLIGDEPKVKVPFTQVKSWCDIHNMERLPRSRGTNRTVCRMCAREYASMRHARLKAQRKAKDV